MEKQYDVIVIGAGAAGLLGALELTLTGKSVVLIEAKERCGGRINTHYLANGIPIELGAEFVHGNLPITQELAQKAKLKMYEVEGSIWQKKQGKLSEQQDFIENFSLLKDKFDQLEYDHSVDDFINLYLQGEQFQGLRFTLRNYVEGYYAADIKKASTFALREELMNGDDEQYRWEYGYQPLMDYLESECKNRGVEFQFSTTVQQITWQSGKVEALTHTGSFVAKKALITVSVGVLQSEAIGFSPSLPHLSEAARKLGFGHVIKVNLWFAEAFWTKKSYTNSKDMQDLSFLFSDEKIPTWWTRHPKKETLITGWLGGPKAEQFQSASEEEIVAQAIHSLSNIFWIDVIQLNQLLEDAKIYNWSGDAHFRGAYSYEVVNGLEQMRKIVEPVDNTIYFAGEGLYHGKEIGTVEAALQSGRTISQQIIEQFH